MQGDPKAIFNRFSEMIRQSDDTLYLWKYMLHSEIAKLIDFSEDAFTVTYPVNLIKIMAGVGIDDEPVSETVRQHAVFLFAFALQLMLNELACPQALVGAGQERLHVLRLRRLFEPVEETYIHMVYARDHMMRVEGVDKVSMTETPDRVAVFKTEREADRYIELKGKGVPIYKVRFRCRVVKDNATGSTFFISLNRRNKRSASRQLKNQVKLGQIKISEFDEEFFKDGVGSRYAVIAILTEKGELKAPTREDVSEWFLDIVRQRLWSDQELTLKDTEVNGQSSSSKYKSCNYWDCKLHGFLSIDPSTRLDLNDKSDILPCVLVEEILMTGWDFLSSLMSIGDDNHGVRLPIKLVDFFTQQLPADILENVRNFLGWRKPAGESEQAIYKKWLSRQINKRRD